MFIIEQIKTLSETKSPEQAVPTPGLPSVLPTAAQAPHFGQTDDVPQNSAEFRPIPSDSTLEGTQIVQKQRQDLKHPPGIFAEKISPDQRSQLFEWLSDHTYDEVIDLVAAEPPAGFGMKVGKTTLCRFYKAHFGEINALRQKRVEARSIDMMDPKHSRDFRDLLRDSTTQLLLERLWELLSRPVQSADELKTLAAIAAKMNTVNPDKDLKDELRQEARQYELEQLLSVLNTASGRKV